MKSLFDQSNTSEMIRRIEKLSPEAHRQWGKMEVAQMVAHCANAIEMAMGIINPPRVFIGRLIGGFFKSKYTEDKPFTQDNPTSETIKVTDVRNFNVEKERLIQRVNEFASGGEVKCTRHPHPFFGNLTPAEWGIGMHKHLDHHLRQFGG